MNLKKNFRPFALAGVMILTGVSACRRHPQQSMEEPIVVRMDDSVLTLREVEERIPAGLSEEDSVALAQALIDGWLEDRLCAAYLSSDPADEARIRRMTDDYRRKLRLEAYRARIRRERQIPVSEDSVKAYYALHKQEMILERPLVKGVLVRYEEDSPLLDEGRRLLVRATAEDLERLEAESGPTLIGVDYFGERWVDFDALEAEIPYPFGDPDRFLETNRDLETTRGGITYLLHLYDHIPSGEVIPYDFAVPQIRDLLQESRLEAYRRALLRALKEKARRDGRLTEE